MTSPLAAALDQHMAEFLEQPESFDSSGVVAANIERLLREAGYEVQAAQEAPAPEGLRWTAWTRAQSFRDGLVALQHERVAQITVGDVSALLASVGCGDRAEARPPEGLDTETLQYALEAVDPVAFARDGTAALSREDVDHFRYAAALAAEYARLSAGGATKP